MDIDKLTSIIQSASDSANGAKHEAEILRNEIKAKHNGNLPQGLPQYISGQLRADCTFSSQNLQHYLDSAERLAARIHASFDSMDSRRQSLC